MFFVWLQVYLWMTLVIGDSRPMSMNETLPKTWYTHSTKSYNDNNQQNNNNIKIRTRSWSGQSPNFDQLTHRTMCTMYTVHICRSFGLNKWSIANVNLQLMILLNLNDLWSILKILTIGICFFFFAVYKGNEYST